MKKRWFESLLVLLVCLLGLTVQASAATTVASGDCGPTANWTLDSDGVLTIGGSGSMNTFYSAANQPWYDHADSIRSIVVEEGITEIGSFAFANLPSLNGTLTLPEGLTSIENHAFYGCSGLTGDLIIPDSVTSLGNYAFYDCTGFDGDLYLGDGLPAYEHAINRAVFTGFTGDLYVGSGIGAIPDYESAYPNPVYAFHGLSNFTGTLTIGEGITAIGASAFEGCSGFTGDLVIPDTVTSIGDSAFEGCSGFTGTLTLPDKLDALGAFAFYNCSGFTGSLVLPAGFPTLGNHTFNGCSGFSGDLVIPDSVTAIGAYTFRGCTGFNGKLTLSPALASIGISAFADCTGFTGDLALPDSLTFMDSYAFYGCTGFDGSLTLPDGLTEIPTGAFQGCSGFTGSLVIPNAVTKINTYAFSDCGFDEDLIIGNRVSSIDYYAFSGCSRFTGDLIIGDSLTSVPSTIFSGCTGFRGNLVIGSGIKNATKSDLPTTFQGRLILKEGVESVGDFSGFGFTGDLILPESLTTVGDGAFKNCTGLSGDLVFLADEVTVGEAAFSGCSGFSGDLTIHSGAIGEKAFYGCSGFSGALTMEGGSIASYAFSGCSGLSSIDVTTGALGACAFENCTLRGQLTVCGDIGTTPFSGGSFSGTLTLLEGVTSIGTKAFQNCSGITGQLSLPSGLTSIGAYAFDGCSGITGAVVLPAGLTTLGTYAFQNCSGITGVTVPGSAVNVPQYAFAGCSSLRSVSLRNGITKIDIYAFQNTDLRGILLPPTTTNVYNYAFDGCENLNNISIPAGATLSNNALANCGSLQSIFYGGTEWDWLYMDSSLKKFGAKQATVYYESYSSCSVEIQEGYAFYINAEESVTLNAIYSTAEEPAEVADGVVWTVDDPDALHISSTSYRIADGVVYLTATFTGTGAGNVNVTVTTPDGARDTAVIHVNDDKSLTIQDKPAEDEGPLQLKPEQSAVITAEYYTARSAEKEVGQIQWESSEPDVLAIESTTCTLGSDGHTATLTATIRGLAHGASTLTVTGPGSTEDSLDVIVPVTIIHMLSTADAKVPELDEPTAVIAPGGDTLTLYAAYDTVGDVAEELDELEWIVSDESVLEQTGSTTYYTRSDGTVIVTADFRAKSLTECTVTLKRGDIAQDECLVQPFFNVPRYRADKFHEEDFSGLESLESILALDTPCEIFADALQKQNFGTAVAAWEALDAMLGSSPSKVKDFVMGPSDIYSAIILNMLESASETALKNDGLAAAKTYTKLMGEAAKVTGSVAKFDKLTADQQDKLVYVLNKSLLGGFNTDTLDKVTADAAFTTKILKGASVYMQNASTVLDGVDAYLNAVTIARMSDSLLAVVEEMYELCPYTDVYLKEALKDCVDIIHGSQEELMASVCGGTLTAVGVNGCFTVLDHFWNESVELFLESFPAIKTLRTAARGAQLATNVLFSTDGTTDKYFQLVAMLEVEELAEQAMWTLLEADDGTDTAADNFLTAVDLVFVLRDQDCLKANDFLETLDDGLWGAIDAAFSSYDEDVAATLVNFRKDYALARENARTCWLYTLSTDYPGSTLEEYYDYEFWASYERLVNTNYEIACPVDVYVYDSADALVASVVDGSPAGGSEAVSVMTDGETKWVEITDSQAYTISCAGSGNGVMDVTVTEYTEDGTESRTVYYYDIPVSTSTTHVVENGALTESDGSIVNPDLDSSQTEALTSYTLTATSATILLEDGAATSGAYYPGSTVRVSAYAPAGLVFLGWTSTMGDGIFADPAACTTTLRMPAEDVEVYPLFRAAPAAANAALTGVYNDGQLQVTVTNATDYRLDGQLWAAVYDQSGMFKEAASCSVTVAAGETGTVVLPCPLADGDTAKVFLVDASSFAPLAEAIPIT